MAPSGRTDPQFCMQGTFVMLIPKNIFGGNFFFIFVKLLALALTNLVTNLAKPSPGQPSHKPDQT